MGNCKIHPNVEFDSWEECPACKAQRKSSLEAKKRHDELITAQAEAARIAEEQLEEQRRFAEEQRELAEQQADLLRSQAQAAEESLRIHRKRLEAELERQAEEEERRRREEEYRELRTGLPEFSDAFRAKWYQISQATQSLETDIQKRDADLRSLDQKLAVQRSKLETIEQRIRLANSRDFDVFLKQARMVGGGGTSPGDPLSSAVPANSRLFTLYNEVFASSVLKRHLKTIIQDMRPLSRILNARDLLLALQDIGALEYRFPAAAESKIPKGCGVACAMGVCLGAVILLLSRSPMLIIAWVVETSPVALPVLYFTHFRPRQQKAQLNRIHSLAKEFQAQVVTLLETIRPEVLRPQGLIIKKDPRQDPKVLYESLYHTMVIDYCEANALRPDLAPELREAQAQLQALTDERAERENRFRMEHPNEEQIRVQYNYLREEIRRVGSEILRGIRVAEKKIQVIECPRCGGPASEEAARCPYCGNEFSQVR